jgi:AbrB family looped-hinge helix DNA binding protein
MTTIVKATTKGQITIPIAWRKKFNTDRFIIEIKDNDVLELRPLDIDEQWEEVVDFTQVQDGGVAIEDVITALS